MKKCPYCEEILGSSVEECFKCGYNFQYKRILRNGNRSEQDIAAYEIYYKIVNDIMNPQSNSTVYNDLLQLYYANKEIEAVSYIEDFFQCDNKTAKQVFEIFKSKSGPPPSPEQVALANAAWGNMPRCPTCTSINIQKIGESERFGVFSNKIYKIFKCKNCGYMW